MVNLKIIKKYNSISLMVRIAIGLAIGIILGLISPNISVVSLLGTLFVGTLKAAAPVLVMTLVVASLAQGKKLDRRFGHVILLYMVSTLLAAVVAVAGSFLFPQTLKLAGRATEGALPANLSDVLNNLLNDMVTNPISALLEGKYIGILFWAIIFGLAARKVCSDQTKKMMSNLADLMSQVIRWVFNFAPFGIMGLVYSSVAKRGLSIFGDYGAIILLLVGCMLSVALVTNPLLVWLSLRRNPYPLVFRCLRGSAVSAFFTRSSAANIPVNMELCKKLGMDEEMYAVSIPLGATVNMDGAAVTIAVMALAAANTVGIQVAFPAALMLAFVAALAACGASGVAGGSLLLIPLACSLFGIDPDVALQVVGVGFIISVLQDSVETALNSSSDVLFSATAEYAQWKKKGKSLPTFLGGTTKVDI